MATESIFKKYIPWTFAGIVILALAITVFIQNRRINLLTGEADVSSPQDENAECKAEIDKLKAQIADMQAWQDYLEGALNDNNVGVIYSSRNRSAGNSNAEDAPRIADIRGMRNGFRAAISSRYDAMAEEIGLSEETKTKLMSLFEEMRLEIMEKMPRGRGFRPEEIDREAIRQQIEEINSKYNEKISELLTEDELNAFSEYQNSEQERMLIMGFSGGNIFGEEGDTLLDEDTEKELVAALYSARQTNPDTKSEEGSISLLGGRFGGGPPQMNEGADNTEKLNSVYLETAKDILSDDQMQSFEDYLNNRQSMFGRGRGPGGPGRFPGAE